MSAACLATSSESDSSSWPWSLAEIVKAAPASSLAVAFAVGVLSSACIGLRISAIRSYSGDSESDYEDESSCSEQEDHEVKDEPYKMVMVVRMDLKMGKGKIAAQCCHACLGAYKRASKQAIMHWTRLGQTKLTLKCNTKEDLFSIAQQASDAKLPFYLVTDAGRTQIAAGSQTVCAIGPAPESDINKITGGLKLM